MKKLIKSISVCVVFVVCFLILPAKAFTQNQTVSFNLPLPTSSFDYVSIGNQEYKGYVSVSGTLVSDNEFQWNGEQGTIILFNDFKTLQNFTILISPWIGTNIDGSKFITVSIKDNDTGEFSNYFNLTLNG